MFDQKFVLWVKKAGIRALKTLCQTAVATIGTSTIIDSVNWPLVVSASVISAILSILTSVAGLPEVDESEMVVKDEEDRK